MQHPTPSPAVDPRAARSPWQRLVCLAVAAALAGGCGSGDARDPRAEALERTRSKGMRIIPEPPPIRYLFPGQKPSPMIGPFESMLNAEQARARLPEGLKVEEIAKPRIEARGHCPGLDELEIRVFRYPHLGQEGQLRLRFYDDALTFARFTPREDFPRYIDSLEQRLGAVLARRKRHLVPPATWVYRDQLLGGNASVVWEDGRLLDLARSIERACRYQKQREEIAAGRIVIGEDGRGRYRD